MCWYKKRRNCFGKSPHNRCEQFQLRGQKCISNGAASSHCNNCSKIVPFFKCQKWVGIRTETNTVPRSTQIQVKILVCTVIKRDCKTNV